LRPLSRPSPSTGRLLKIYARFLEWVANEPSRAQRYYEVGRVGEGLWQGAGAWRLECRGVSHGNQKSPCRAPPPLPPQEATKLGLQDSLLDLLRGSSAEGTSTSKVGGDGSGGRGEQDQSRCLRPAL
jgi:hypothetical protein